MNPQYITELDSFSLFVYFKLIHTRRASVFLRFCKEASPVDLVTFTEEILNGKLHFLCSETQSFL